MINKEDYDYIANNIDNIQNSLEQILFILSETSAINSTTTLSNRSVVREQILGEIYNSYTIALDVFNEDISMGSLVKSLQSYIVNNLGSLDDFYSDNYVLVPLSFASISDKQGYIVSSEFIG